MEKGETPNDIISQQNERIQEYIKQRKSENGTKRKKNRSKYR